MGLRLARSVTADVLSAGFARPLAADYLRRYAAREH